MGFSAVQQQCEGSSSSLEHLQLRLITVETLSSSELFQAVAEDIAQGRDLNQTILIKLFSSHKITLTSFDFQKLALLIRDSMIRLPLSRAELFINYAQSAALCMKGIYSC